jgi:hypothetical protein
MGTDVPIFKSLRHIHLRLQLLERLTVPFSCAAKRSAAAATATPG